MTYTDGESWACDWLLIWLVANNPNHFCCCFQWPEITNRTKRRNPSHTFLALRSPLLILLTQKEEASWVISPTVTLPRASLPLRPPCKMKSPEPWRISSGLTWASEILRTTCHRTSSTGQLSSTKPYPRFPNSDWWTDILWQWNRPNFQTGSKLQSWNGSMSCTVYRCHWVL